MRKKPTAEELSKVQQQLDTLRAAKFAKLDAQDAKFKTWRDAARASLRAEKREFVFRLFHPIKSIQTKWKHKAPHGSLLHPLYEADMASGVKA